MPLDITEDGLASLSLTSWEHGNQKPGVNTSIGPLLVFAACLFNLILCFFTTRHWVPIGNGPVTGCELLILLIGAAAIWPHLGTKSLSICILVAALVVGLKLLNSGVNMKILADFGITFIFYKLGTLTKPEVGNRIVWAIMAIVLVFGFFELLLPTVFTTVFDIWSYYVGKGSISGTAVDYSGSNLFVSGERAGSLSRTLLPGLLGPHRVSSIFLEPVSMGNFAVLVLAWCLCTTTGTARGRIALGACAFICVVLGDSRFGILCCFILIAARLVPLLHFRLLVLLLPVFVLLGLTILGSLHELPGVQPSIASDDLSGRLIFSGRLLDSWNIWNWLGLSVSPVYTADTGYAYVINNLGLPLAVILAAIFAAHPTGSRTAAGMKIMIAIYFAASLCIGASVFSIKTGALLWFLYGTTNGLFAARSAASETGSIA